MMYSMNMKFSAWKSKELKHYRDKGLNNVLEIYDLVQSCHLDSSDSNGPSSLMRRNGHCLIYLSVPAKLTCSRHQKGCVAIAVNIDRLQSRFWR